MQMSWFEQGPDFDFGEFIKKNKKRFTIRFYCPSCGEKVVFHLDNDVEDETYECTMCNGVMLREETNDNNSGGD
jgi:transcription elongation factor Elf1